MIVFTITDKLFCSKPILRFGATSFLFRFVVLSFLTLLLALFPAYREKRLYFPQSYLPYSGWRASRQFIFKQNILLKFSLANYEVYGFIIIFSDFITLLCSRRIYEINVDIFTDSISAKEKKSLLDSIYRCYPQGPPSITVGSKMLVQPAKSASPIGHLSEL